MRQLIPYCCAFLLASSLFAEDVSDKFKMSLQSGLTYSSNPYSLTNTQRANRAVGDMLIKLKPELLFTAQGRRLVLSLDGYSDMGYTVGLNNNPGFLVFSGVANGSGIYNQGGEVSFFTQGGLSATRSLGEIFVGNLTNVVGRGSVGSTYRPGGGKLSITAQGEYQVQGYPGLNYQGQNSTPRSLNNQAYYFSSRVAWQFLPKTALYLEGRYGYFESVDSNQINLSSNPLWFGGGLTGRITPTLTGSLSAQFSRVFLKVGAQSLSSTSFPMSAKLSIDWTYDARSNLNVVLGRDMNPTPIFLDQFSNNLQLSWSHLLFSRVTLKVNSQLGFLEYGKPYTTLTPTQARLDESVANRKDLFTGAGVSCSYAFSDWFALGVGGDAFWRWTNTDPTNALGAGGFVAAGGGGNYISLFNRYEVNAFVRLTY